MRIGTRAHTKFEFPLREFELRLVEKWVSKNSIFGDVDKKLCRNWLPEKTFYNLGNI